MTDMIILIILVIIVMFFLLATQGRSGHSGLCALRGWNYAHRGLHGNGVPENSMEAFRLALEQGYGIELDIHLLKDGNLAVIHDSSLLRTAGVDIRVEELTLPELHNYRLEGTQETIPAFRDVLELFDGKAPLIVELKPEGNNYAALSQAAMDLLSAYRGVYCIESFDPRCVHWFTKNRPDVIRGQLAENFFKSKASKLPAVLKFVMTLNLLNFLTKPDFVAYRFGDRKNLSIGVCCKLWKMQGVTWTLRNQEDHRIAVAENWIPIFEYYNP